MKKMEKFDIFLSVYKPDMDAREAKFDRDLKIFSIDGFAELFSSFLGCSFGSGIYRLFDVNEIEKWDDIVTGIFSQYKHQINCFASDWMGRVFAWDYKREKILLLDPGFGEALKIPCNFYELHNKEFVDYSDESLSKNLYDKLLDSRNINLTRMQCFGYKISPFLGGEDQLDNMEMIDMEVYWSICEDIYFQTNS